MTRIVNTNFFADPVNGARTPEQTNEDPVIVLPGGGDPDTDPGDGDGGDIGDPGGDPVTPPPVVDPTPDPDGNGVITVGNAPTITRRYQGTVYSTRIDTYPQQGQTFSITYIADGDCTLLPKLGWEDMIVSYSTNGREMTLTRNIPADEPGDSWWVGVEAWIYGGDNVEAYTLDYDRVHVGKSQSDVILAGTTGSTQSQVETAGLSAGDTVIIRNGNKTQSTDTIQVGSDNYLNTFGSASEIPNGIHTDRAIFQNPNSPGTQTSTTADVTKYTTIMTQTPLGVILDRQNRAGGIGINGNIPNFPGSGNNQNGGREATGIKIKGFGLKNSAAFLYYSVPIRTQKATNCSIDACYYINDLTLGETSLSGRIWTGDGSDTAHSNSESCGMVYGGGIGTTRLMHAQVAKTNNCTHSRFLTCNGPTQLFYEAITQTFTSYPAQNGYYRNCLSVDGYLFYRGHLNEGDGTRRDPIANYCFNQTNGGNDNMTMEACIMFNDTRGFVQTNASGGLYGQRDNIIDCVGFHSRKNEIFRLDSGILSNYEWVRGGPYDLTRCTFGRNEDFSAGTSGVGSFETYFQRRDGTTSRLSNLLINQPSWDYPLGRDSVFTSPVSTFNLLNNIAIAGAVYPISTAILNATTGFYTYPNTISNGLQYWVRVDEGSLFQQLGVGAQDPMCARGLYGVTPTDTRSGFDTVYNGKNGNPYVNWISRSPWIEQRQLWRDFDCTSRGTRYRGNVGWAASGVNPIDYLLRQGTTPQKPINTPYIEDVYVYLNANSQPVLAWRPICPAYRATITGYDIFIDNQPAVQNVSRQATAFTFTGVASGRRKFNIVVKDSTYGNSGFSRSVIIVVP